MKSKNKQTKKKKKITTHNTTHTITTRWVQKFIWERASRIIGNSKKSMEQKAVSNRSGTK